MEKIREEEVTTVKTIHEFYCDNCGEKISELEEVVIDGHPLAFKRVDIGQYGHTILLNDCTLTLCKNLCPDCAIKEEDKLVSAFKALGFVESI